jgi:hypothetical protein
MTTWWTQPGRFAAPALCAVLAATRIAAGESLVTPAMTGQWQGNARIIVTWCRQTNLPVTLDIRAGGTVAGKVGDATLVNGRLERNRGWLGRKLNLKTDYIVRGDLRGPIVAAEQISRSAVSMPLNFTSAGFVGGIHSSGSKTGGKARMILSASSLKLTRTNGS